MLRRIHNGERDPKTLLPGLDEIEAAITQRVLAYLAGNPDIGIDPDAWRTLTDTKDDTDSGEDNLEAFIAAAVEAARGNAEAREALGRRWTNSLQTLTPPPSPQPSRTHPPATTRLRHYPTSIRTTPPSWKRSAVGSPNPRMTDGFQSGLTDRIVDNDEFVTPGQKANRCLL